MIVIPCTNKSEADKLSALRNRIMDTKRAFVTTMNLTHDEMKLLNRKESIFKDEMTIFVWADEEKK